VRRQQLGMRSTEARQRLRRLAAGEFVVRAGAVVRRVTVKVGDVRSRHGTLGELGARPYQPAMSLQEVQEHLSTIATTDAG
jgi:hypothetical protein